MTAPDPATWFVGHIGAAAIKTNLTDPINALSGLIATTAHHYLTQTVGKSIPDSTWTTVDGWATGEPTIGMGSYGAGIRTIVTDGMYVITGQVTYGPAASPAGQRAVRLYVNSTLVHEYAGARPDTFFNTSLPIYHTQRLAVGDTVHIETYQSQGTSQSLLSAAGMNHWSMTYTGPA